MGIVQGLSGKHYPIAYLEVALGRCLTVTWDEHRGKGFGHECLDEPAEPLGCGVACLCKRSLPYTLSPARSCKTK